MGAFTILVSKVKERPDLGNSIHFTDNTEYLVELGFRPTLWRMDTNLDCIPSSYPIRIGILYLGILKGVAEG
tara:strand:+ start:182 stop:397 length:216 start_codon:yes stop_codon:yes gene_type:complete